MTYHKILAALAVIFGLAACGTAPENKSDIVADVIVGDLSVSCAEDPACVNRIHPDTPMIAEADPGERIVFLSRDAFDLTLDPDEFSSAKMNPRHCLLYTSPSPRDQRGSRMPSSA